MDKKVKTARLSIISNTSLIVLKLVAGFLSGSVSIISEAIHSAMDLLASIIAFFAVKISDSPPDKEHPYGHGKFENVSGVIEAVLIFVAAGWIIFEAIEKLHHPGPINSIGIGAAVMFVSGLVNWFVARRLYKVARETDSIALEADALHLKTDVYTSVGVGSGLLLIWATGYHFLDPVIAILVAMFIIRESFHLLKNAYTPLLDVSLSEKEIAIIKECISEHSLTFHDLKTRKSGQFRFADLHLEMDGATSLQKVHDVCDMIEEEIKKKINNIDINIHVEPKE